MKLSVVVVTYNRPEGLDATLASVSAQTRPADEVIVCDDASPKDPTPVIESWKETIPNLKFQRNARNLGMPGNLNQGIRMASGDIVCNLHDADTYEPTLFARCEELFYKYPSVGMVHWNLFGRGNYNEGKELPELCTGREFFKKYYYGKAHSIIWGTAMVRSRSYKKYLPFDARFKAWSDVDMWMRICLTDDIGYVKEPMVTLHEGGPFRWWDWEKTLLIQRMFFLNVRRHFAHDQAKLERALRKQLSCQRYRWFRHMVGRLKRGELGNAIKGLVILPRYLKLPPEEPLQPHG